MQINKNTIEAITSFSDDLPKIALYFVGKAASMCGLIKIAKKVTTFEAHGVFINKNEINNKLNVIPSFVNVLP